MAQPCVSFYRFTAVLMAVLGVVAGSGPGFLGNGVQPDSLDHHGNILSPLLKALSEQEPWGAAPRTRPDSRYVRFMKRLYKLSSRPERSSEAEQLYNTARLITPRQECLGHSREYFTQDISYSLDRVRAQEHLLKSVLLYSVNHNLAASLASICYLHVKEHMPSDDHVCPHSHSSARSATPVSFHVRSERAGRRKWAEVDVTPFLQPLIRGHNKKDLHLLLNLTCLDDGLHGRSGRSPLELSHVAPSLLLYLNDTSEVAYRRSSAHSRFGSFRSNHWDAKPLRHDHHSGLDQHVWRDRRSTLNSSQEPKPSTDTNLSNYEFPTDECDLFDFRVSFSQLKLDHWIIEPHKYNPRYCKGICPRAVGYIYGSPVHTMVQNIIYEKLDSSIPRPSCVPSEYDPLSVLTIENDGSIAYKEYEEMIATKCTCR